MQISLKHTKSKDKNKNHKLWTAVAFQSYISTELKHNSLAPLSIVQNTNNFNRINVNNLKLSKYDPLEPLVVPGMDSQKQFNKPLTLAQKMNIEPLPPPRPSEAEWINIKQKALANNELHKPCSICLQPLYNFNTNARESSLVPYLPVLLSCSHFFHLNCLQKLESFASKHKDTLFRVLCNGRDNCVKNSDIIDYEFYNEYRYTSHVRSCPICRMKHYHKRIFYEGIAFIENYVIIRIQSIYRSYIQRKKYKHMLLKHRDLAYKSSYYLNALNRINQKYINYINHRFSTMQLTLQRMEFNRALTLAHETSFEHWQYLREKCLLLLSFSLFKKKIVSMPYTKNTKIKSIPVYHSKKFKNLYKLRKLKGNSSLQDLNKIKDCNYVISMDNFRYIGIPTSKNKVYNYEISILRQLIEPEPMHISKEANNSLDCSICMSPIEIHQCLPDISPNNKSNVNMVSKELVTLLSCSHVYHRNCLESFELYMKREFVDISNKYGSTCNNQFYPICPICRSPYVRIDLCAI